MAPTGDSGPRESIDPDGRSSPAHRLLKHELREARHTLSASESTLPLVHAIIDLAFEKKAFTPRVYDVAALTGYTDYVVVLSGRSDRQVRAIADHVAGTLKQDHGVRTLGIEGEDLSQWILIDLGDVVVHVFNAPVRDYYDLDGLFQDAPRVPVDDPPWESEIRDAVYEQPAYSP